MISFCFLGKQKSCQSPAGKFEWAQNNWKIVNRLQRNHRYLRTKSQVSWDKILIYEAFIPVNQVMKNVNSSAYIHTYVQVGTY